MIVQRPQQVQLSKCAVDDIRVYSPMSCRHDDHHLGLWGRTVKAAERRSEWVLCSWCEHTLSDTPFTTGFHFILSVCPESSCTHVRLGGTARRYQRGNSVFRQVGIKGLVSAFRMQKFLPYKVNDIKIKEDFSIKF